MATKAKRKRVQSKPQGKKRLRAGKSATDKNYKKNFKPDKFAQAIRAAILDPKTGQISAARQEALCKLNGINYRNYTHIKTLGMRQMIVNSILRGIENNGGKVKLRVPKKLAPRARAKPASDAPAAPSVAA